MSAFIKLNTQDAFVAPYTAHKLYDLETPAELNSAGVDRFYGVEDSNITTGYISTYTQDELHKSIKHLYYTAFNTSNTIDGSYEHYLQSSLDPQRTLETEFAIISIPKTLFGDNIHPGTVSINIQGDEITDNGEGVLYCNDEVVGNILYSHGMVIITDEQPFSVASFAGIESTSDIRIVFRNSYTLFEHQYRCKINQSQLSHTNNPSAHTDGVLNSNVDIDYFQPYITTVGLFNDAHELVAIGKLNKPVPKSKYNDMTFVVKFDA